MGFKEGLSGGFNIERGVTAVQREDLIQRGMSGLFKSGRGRGFITGEKVLHG